MESESVIAFRADPMTHCLSARPRMGAPGEYSLEHRLSQNPPRLRSRESILGHPGPDTAGSLVKGASCRRWVGFEKEIGCYIHGQAVAWQDWRVVLFVAHCLRQLRAPATLWGKLGSCVEMHGIGSYPLWLPLFWLGLRLWLIKSGIWCDLEVCAWVGSGSRPASLQPSWSPAVLDKHCLLLSSSSWLFPNWQQASFRSEAFLEISWFTV